MIINGGGGGDGGGGDIQSEISLQDLQAFVGVHGLGISRTTLQEMVGRASAKRRDWRARGRDQPRRVRTSQPRRVRTSIDWSREREREMCDHAGRILVSPSFAAHLCTPHVPFPPERRHI